MDERKDEEQVERNIRKKELDEATYKINKVGNATEPDGITPKEIKYIVIVHIYREWHNCRGINSTQYVA